MDRLKKCRYHLTYLLLLVIKSFSVVGKIDPFANQVM